MNKYCLKIYRTVGRLFFGSLVVLFFLSVWAAPSSYASYAGDAYYRGCGGSGDTLNSGNTVSGDGNYTTVVNWAHGSGDITTNGGVIFGPGNGWCSEKFNVHFSRSVNFSGGTYIFAANYDDGIYVTVSGVGAVLQKGWSSPTGGDPGNRTFTSGVDYGSSVSIPAGTRTVDITVANGVGYGGCCAVGAWVGYKSVAPSPYYTAKSPIGGVTISTFYPTFVWEANTTGVGYNNICVGTSSSSNPCLYTPSLSDRSFTATQALSPGTTYYWLIYGGPQTGLSSGWQQFKTPTNAPPTNVETFINSVVLADGATQYNITVQGWDTDGGGDVKNQYAMINYQGSNAGQYRGYVGWTANQSNYAYWGGNFSQQVQCSGAGGWAAKYSGYGPEYLELDSCSSNINPNNYKMLQVYFTVRFNTNFTSPSTGNTVSGWLVDSAGQAYGWKAGATFSISSPPRTYNVTAQPVCTNGSSATPNHVTRLWYVKNSDPGYYSYVDPTATLGSKTANITIASDAGYVSMLGMDDGTDPGNLNTNSSPPSGVTKNSTTYSWYKSNVSSGPLSFDFAAPDAWCPLNGTLSVSTTPVSGAIYVDGSYVGTGSWSGTQSPGSRTVSFGAVTNYNTPAPQSATINANQTTTVTGTYTAQPGTLTVNTSPTGGAVYVNGSSWGAASQSRSLSPGTYTVTFGALTYYNAPAAQSPVVYSNQTTTVTGTYTPTPLSAPSLTCAGTAQTTANCSWGAVTGATRYFFQAGTGSASSGNLASNSNASSPTNFTGLACGTTYYARVRAENGVTVSPWTSDIPFTTSVCTGTVTVGVSGVSSAGYSYTGTGTGSGTAPTTLILPVGPYTFSFPATLPGFVLTGITPSANITVSNGGTSTVTATYTATSTLTINMYNDANSNGVYEPAAGEGPVTGKTLYVTCSPTSGVPLPCPASGYLTIAGSPASVTNLSQADSYTFGYDALYSGNDPYKLWTGYWIDSNPVVNSPLANFPLALGTAKTINFLVSQNSKPWIQVQDGDVYSAYTGVMPGINMTVNPTPDAPYHPFFIADTLSGSGGGLAQTYTNTVSCSSGQCVERVPGSPWVVKSYTGGPAWTTELDTVTGGSNICYVSSGLNINNAAIASTYSSGSCANKVVIVNGDINIDPNFTATADKPINALLVAKGKINVLAGPPGSWKPLIVNGGLYAKGNGAGTSFDFSYSLDNVSQGGNKKPAVVVKYNPDILLNSTPLSTPTYTWREVTAQ